jgi:hypothetical protein
MPGTLRNRAETLLQETHKILQFPTPVQLIGTYEDPKTRASPDQYHRESHDSGPELCREFVPVQDP